MGISLKMDTRNYYSFEILPAYQNFLESLDSEDIGKNIIKSKAIHVCNCLNNLVDYIFKENPSYVLEVWGEKTKEHFRQKIENARPGNNIPGYSMVHGEFFGFIRDIANLSKHSSIGRPNATITDLNNLLESIAIIRYQDSKGYYYSTVRMLIVRNKLGHKIPLEYFILQAFLFLTDILIELKIIPEKPLLKKYKRDFLISRENANLKIKMSLLAGESGSIGMSSFIYEINGYCEIRSLKKGDVFNCKFDTDFAVDKGYFKPKN